MQSFVINLLNGVSYGLLLFMLSAGLTLIFSMLGVLNFAHASFYMLGAYVGYAVAARGGFWAALVIAPVLVGLLGAALERGLLRRVRPHGHLAELLLTFGAAYLIGEAVKLVWGLSSLGAAIPPLLDGPLFTVYGAAFSRYRAFVMLVAVAMLALLYLVLRTSRTGLIVRAALTHPAAVEALGHDVPRVFTLVFAIGTGLAALAGVIGAPLFVIEPAMAESVGPIVFVVVVVGGLGSLGGALAASLLVGCLQTFAVASDVSLGSFAAALGADLPDRWAALTLAQLAPLVPYVLLVAMLAARPRGLFGHSADGANRATPMREPGVTFDANAPSRARLLLPWLALVAFLFVPAVVSTHGWLLAYLAQTASMIVFALSYNLLLGEAGLLSFGHAAHAGLGALIAAQVFARIGLPLPLLPVIGGVGGALSGALLGAIATRRAGTAFAMITLGIGELVSAAAWSLPDWFGGTAGVPIDRTSGVAMNALFGSPRAAYGLIAVWCVVSTVALYALSRTPFIRLANAVRDNPVRAAALGWHPRRVRYAVLVWASGFAGVAGTLALINVELVSTDSVGIARSGAVLFATVIGGTASFFGPIAGAIAFTFCSVAAASVTTAWPCYLGLLFIVIVVGAPDGIAGFMRRHTRRIATYGVRACSGPVLCGMLALAAWLLATVLAVEWLYAIRLASAQGVASPFSEWLPVLAAPALTACAPPFVAAMFAAAGWYSAKASGRGWARIEVAAASRADVDVSAHGAAR